LQYCVVFFQPEIQAFYDAKQITYRGRNIPKPVFKFEEACLPDYILQSIARNNWTAPTPIQSVGWPMAMSGHDVVGIAQTGSGKTASVRHTLTSISSTLLFYFSSFSLLLFTSIISRTLRRVMGPSVLCLCPLVSWPSR
jgi:hypothetical protein